MKTNVFFPLWYRMRAVCAFVLIILLHACSEKIPPEISTVEISESKPPDCGYSEDYAILPSYGSILNPNGDILEAGFCLSENNPEPTVNDLKYIAEITIDTFHCCIWIPYPNVSTTYFIRAYAINEHGVGYGPVVKQNVGGPIGF